MRYLVLGLSMVTGCTTMHANSAALARCPAWHVEVHNASRSTIDVITKEGVIGSVASGAVADFVVPTGTSVSTRLSHGAARTTAATRVLTDVPAGEATPPAEQIRTFYDCNDAQ